MLRYCVKYLAAHQGHIVMCFNSLVATLGLSTAGLICVSTLSSKGQPVFFVLGIVQIHCQIHLHSCTVSLSLLLPLANTWTHYTLNDRYVKGELCHFHNSYMLFLGSKIVQKICENTNNSVLHFEQIIFLGKLHQR